LADVNAKTIYDAIERSDRIGIYSGGPRAPRLFFIRRDSPDFIVAGGTGFMLVEAVLTIARRCAADREECRLSSFRSSTAHEKYASAAIARELSSVSPRPMRAI
jgi:hypothetical protein